MKKFICILCILLSVVLLAGCTADAGDAGGGTATPDLENGSALSGSITFSTWGSLDERRVNEEIIAAFEALHPGVTVYLEFIPDGYMQRITTMFMGGNAPDVIYGHPHMFAQWATRGLLMNLDDRFAENADFFLMNLGFWCKCTIALNMMAAILPL